MSKAKLSIDDTIRIGLVEKVEHDGNVEWKIGKSAPSWAYKYLMFRSIDIDHMTFNRFATKECADWLRVYYPDEAIAMDLADVAKVTRHVGVQVSTRELEYTGVQFSDSKGCHWIRLSSPRCPAALVEYVMTHCPKEVDDLYGRVTSEVFTGDEFAEWVCGRDQRLADILGVGYREAVMLAEPLEWAYK